MKNMRNWYVVPMFKYGLIKRATFVTKRGDRVEINSRSDYTDFFDGEAWARQRLESVKDRVKVADGLLVIDQKYKFSYASGFELAQTMHTIGTIYENEYGILNVNGKTVVDIGANIGDTAIYFAMNGAAKVLSFEPYPSPYELAKRNIALNNLQGKILLFNEGVDAAPDKIRLPEARLNTMGMPLKGQAEGRQVSITTLEQILTRFPGEDMVVKMDCEGCEYGAILKSTDQTLRRFGEFIIEYHHGSGDLVARLKSAGFDVRVMKNLIYARRAS